MSNIEIIIIGMTLSAVIIIIMHLISNAINKMNFDKAVKRTKYIKQLVKENKIPYKLINLNEEKDRVKDTSNHVGLLIDDILYDDKNSLFLNENSKLYIIGKKEDYLIILVGRFIK